MFSMSADRISTFIVRVPGTAVRDGWPRVELNMMNAMMQGMAGMMQQAAMQGAAAAMQPVAQVPTAVAGVAVAAPVPQPC